MTTGGLPTCPWCEKPFRPRRGGGSHQTFCSPRHRMAFHSAARRWAERALASGDLTIGELRKGDTAACTLPRGAAKSSLLCPSSGEGALPYLLRPDRD
jgi:hypothetical protein